VRGVGNKLRELIFQRFRRKSAGRHHENLLTVFCFEQMPDEGCTACASRCPGDHFNAVSAARSRLTMATTLALVERSSRISSSNASCSGS
jgi:hypothetical protein